MKILISILTSLLLVTTIAVANTSEPYKVGVIIPLSGDYSSLGTYVKKGIDLAYAKLPEEKKSRLQLVFEDDQLDQKKSISAFQKLSSTQGLDAALVLGSGVGNALGPIAERRKKVLVAIGASDKKFAVGTQYVFTHWVSPEAEAKVMIDEIQRRGLKRVSVIAQEQEGVIAVMDALMAELKTRGLEDVIVYDYRVLMEDRNFRTFITKARAKKSDGILVCMLTGALSSFAKQAKAAGVGSQIFGFELFEDESEVKASEGALVGAWYVNADEATDEFAKAYDAAYGEAPGFGSANAFDTLNLIADAVQAHGADNDKIAEHLKNLSGYKGAAGIYSATGDNRFELPATVKRVTESGFEKISQ